MGKHIVSNSIYAARVRTAQFMVRHMPYHEINQLFESRRAPFTAYMKNGFVEVTHDRHGIVAQLAEGYASNPEG